VTEDTYAPSAPFVALCPHCASGIPGVPFTGTPMRRALVEWDCPQCGGEWTENRHATTVRRYYEPQAQRVARNP
jgi:hypothetical protein